MEAINGRRVHFTINVTTTPKLVVGAGSRQAVTFVNNSSTPIYLGYSGTLTTNGIILNATSAFHDLFSSDEWWAASASSSGTMSGYSVV